MAREVVLTVIGALLVIGELIVWDQALLWHSKEKRDPRNMRPPY